MTNAGASAAPFQPTAFLDTNVLVRLFQFWDACQTAQIRLDAISDWENLKAALAAASVATGALNGIDADYVKLGMKAFQHLQTSAGDYRYVSSRVCRSEMHHVLLEGRGLEHLKLQGVPHSLRVKRPQVLYRVALNEQDYMHLDTQLETFRTALSLDYSLEVTDVEDSSVDFGVSPDGIWDDAQAIWSHILMEVMDAYLCAAAIRIKADVFITADTSLRDALNRIRDPDSDWATLAASLKRALSMKPTEELPLPLRPGRALPTSLSSP
ncbi:MAG: hypothetical protein OXM62_07255 [bacterium]|nr:hypothetical protein [bacterium]